MKLAPVLAALALLWPVAAAAFDIGPAVGAKVPPIAAKDVTGNPTNIAKLSGKNGVVLVFFRSAKWCPYCMKQLIELKDAKAPLAQRGYNLVALSYDPPEVLTHFTQLQQIPYTFLSDQGSTTIDAFKLRDPQYKADSFAFGVPMPGIFVISPRGVVQAKLAEEGYKTRPPVSAVLAAVDGLKH
ncbi:MAG TPA: peroxiredoxin family protein [Phenylobacterium sp.]|nr:peroxiredoxin family protein [Phenylobacterium sp.]